MSIPQQLARVRLRLFACTCVSACLHSRKCAKTEGQRIPYPELTRRQAASLTLRVLLLILVEISCVHGHVFLVVSMAPSLSLHVLLEVRHVLLVVPIAIGALSLAVQVLLKVLGVLGHELLIVPLACVGTICLKNLQSNHGDQFSHFLELRICGVHYPLVPTTSQSKDDKTPTVPVP